ncbi:amidohydrolase 2 [Colletotrichum karsti]|uniref:Amidohydrolase 2 n=1 Tax=Colletotrichum karsti TaxID=1095194 RepID=A0A9P6IB91_9PEZI|nr:amidohydrolase 2 [Colletotrichum karsti]KAF9880478.1 amidohydrolase 2 [Colletotrichum karsti]
MRIIAFEEHYKHPAIHEANRGHPIEAVYNHVHKATGGQGDDFPPGIRDLGKGRIADMDAAGIDIQILSHTVPSVEGLDPSIAVNLAREANDSVAAATAQYPDRFRGFATLPMSDPTAAAKELERAVDELKFVGALINGHVNERYLDDKFFWPVLETAERLGVPIYLHPQAPPKGVVDAYYSGFAPPVSNALSLAGLGWHIDTGVHCIRLILSGVFDRYPNLQIIVGHNFEALAWMAWRVDYSFSLEASAGLKKTMKEYLRENFYGGILAGEYFAQEPGKIDPSWSLAYNAYLGMANVIGTDRILFTSDYPYGNIKASRQFLDELPISVSDKEKIAHLNAERLLGL